MTLLGSILLFITVDAQILQGFNTLIGGNEKNFFEITNKTTLYVSAYSDSADLLKLIYFHTAGSNGYETADSLQNYFDDFSNDVRIGWGLSGDLTITANLTQQQLDTLTGSFYIVTHKQHQNHDFNVYDAMHLYTIHSTNLETKTAVILNSDFQTNPSQATRISNWKQDPNAVVQIFRGIPTDIEQPDSEAIFTNPVDALFHDSPVFVENVELFSIIGPFYVKMKGDVSFDIDNGYVDQYLVSTTKCTTTGLISKGANQNDLGSRVAITQCSNNGSTGANTIAYQIPDDGYVKVELICDNFEQVDEIKTNAVRSQCVTDKISNGLIVSSELGTNTKYYVQYYVLDGISPIDTQN